MEELYEYIEKLKNMYNVNIFLTSYEHNLLNGEILPYWTQQKIKQYCNDTDLLEILSDRNTKKSILQSHICLSKDVKTTDKLSNYLVVRKDNTFAQIYCIMPLTTKKGCIVIVESCMLDFASDNDGFLRICKTIYYKINQFIKYKLAQ